MSARGDIGEAVRRSVCPKCDRTTEKFSIHRDVECRTIRAAKEQYDIEAGEVELVYVGANSFKQWLEANDGIWFGDRSTKRDLNQAVRETLVGRRSKKAKNKGFVETLKRSAQTDHYLLVKNQGDKQDIYKKKEPGSTRKRKFLRYRNKEESVRSSDGRGGSIVSNLDEADLPEHLLFTNDGDLFGKQVRNTDGLPKSLQAAHTASLI